MYYIKLKSKIHSLHNIIVLQLRINLQRIYKQFVEHDFIYFKLLDSISIIRLALVYLFYLS